MIIKELFDKYVSSKGLRNTNESESDWAEFGQSIYKEFLWEAEKAEKEAYKKEQNMDIVIQLFNYHTPKKIKDKFAENLTEETNKYVKHLSK